MQEEHDNIFKRALGVYGGYWRIPDPVFMLLHWVTPELHAEDYANLTLRDPDVVRIYALDCEMTIPQMTAMAKRMRPDFVVKEPEDYTYYDLIVLRQIMCPWNKADIDRARTHPSQYKEAAIGLSKLDRCPAEVYEGLASVAAQPETLWAAAEVQPIEELVGVRYFSGLSERDDSPDSR